MKSNLLFLMCLLFAAHVSAQTASGMCSLPNQNTYINVNYYDEGYFIISNQSGLPISEVKVTITCVQRWTTTHKSPYDGGTVYDQHSRVVTLYDGTVYDLPTYQSVKIMEKVSSITYSDKYKITDITVSVSNPICK